MKIALRLEQTVIEVLFSTLVGKTIKSIQSCTNALYITFTDETDVTIDTEYQGYGVYGPVIYSGNPCQFESDIKTVYSNGKR